MQQLIIPDYTRQNLHKNATFAHCLLRIIITFIDICRVACFTAGCKKKYD